MDQRSIIKQTFDFQKNTIDAFMDSISTIQDQAERSWNFMLDRNPWVPEESKSVFLELENIAKRSRDDFKQIMDDGVDRMQSYLETASSAAQQAAQQTSKASARAGEKASESLSRNLEGEKGGQR